MEFTFFEYNLIILTTSFIIFSLAIKSESYKKYSDFSLYAKHIKKFVYDSINKKSIKSLREKKRSLIELVDSKEEISSFCLKKVTNYIYHSFYFIFILSAWGLLSSIIFELNLFKITNFLNIWWLEPLIHFLAFLLLYWVLRAIFALICYTKIDIEYFEKLYKRISDIIYYNIGDVESNKINLDITFKFLKINLLIILFFVFLMWDKKFKQFFYKYYHL